MAPFVGSVKQEVSIKIHFRRSFQAFATRSLPSTSRPTRTIQKPLLLCAVPSLLLKLFTKTTHLSRLKWPTRLQRTAKTKMHLQGLLSRALGMVEGAPTSIYSDMKFYVDLVFSTLRLLQLFGVARGFCFFVSLYRGSTSLSKSHRVSGFVFD